MTLLSSATFPLSQAQMRIWYMEKINQGTPMNNIVGTMFFQHRMEEAVLTQAIRLFLEQHEEVRLRLIEEDGLPRQFFDSRPVGDIERIEFEEEAHLQAYAAAEASKPIDLMREDLCRFTVFTLPGERVGLLLKMHHLISDAWTMTLIGSLLMDDYQALLNGQAPVKKSDYSYLTYLNEEYDFLQSDRAAKMKEFWRQKFAELPERTTLSSRQQVPGQTQAKRESFVLSEGLTERIHAFCQEHRLSVFSLFLSLLYVYINRTKLAPEATVLTSVLNRHSARDKSTIGMFVSTMPIRLTVDEQESYVEFADRIKREQKACYRNQRYPYNLLVNDLREDHGMSADELFDVVFSYQNAKFAQGDHGYQYDTQWHFTGHQTNSLTFHVYDHEERGQLKLDFDYRVDQFTADELQRLYKRLMMLLADVMAHPEKKVSDLNLLPEAEREQLLFGFNETKRAFPDDRLLQELFEEQATRQPEHPALVFEGRTLTYGEVNEQANALAHQLRERGVGVETVVGVLTNRSLEGIVAILGILKAGGAFLPIDPEYPQERIEYMLEISQAEMLLVQSALTQRAAGFAGEVLLLDEAALYQGKTDNPEPLQTSTDLGYIIFSSGSTGRPKGSMLTHKSLVNWLYAMNDLLDGEIGSDDRCLSLANSSFDANVGEIFLPLVFGGTLVLFNTRPFDILKLVDVMESERATMALLMPFLLKDLHPFLHGRDLCLNKIWTGAESVQDTVVEQYFNLLPDLKVLNVYGPSETTIGAAIHRYESQDKATGKFLPIGKPIANTQIYIVGHGDRLQPIGEPGEILIGGDGVGVGYINQPELTAERFVPNPFDSGTRAYRTGDLARWLPDGTLEFLSRIDYQVKIRGFRIEIGEIETALSAHPQVDNVFVTDRLDKNENKYLCAYLVTGAALTSGDLRRYLSDLLPEYMVPSYFMFLDRIPTTPNGKVDKNALPEPELNGQAGGLQLAPRDELEASVAAIWSDVLELEPEQVGIQDNFFDLGGHSLKASTLIARIYQKTGVKLPLRAVFQSGTIEGLAALIRSTEQEGFAPIERVAEAGDYSLSSAQHRLFILQQLSEQDTAYNMPGALQLEGDLDVERLEAAVRSVITRHDALRTAFVRVEGEPRQVVREAVDFTLPLIEGQEAERQARMRAFVQPFDLTQAPLFRMQLLRVAPKRHLLLFDMHHIISDGASINLLLQELIAAYRGEELQPLAIQYKDYAAWQDGFFTTERLQGQQAYWTEQFADEVPVLNLTGDFSRPTVMEHAGHALRFEVGRELTDRLRVLANDNGLTLYMILLAAYSLLLGKYANQEDLVIGTPVSGRAHPDAESVMGMFVNTLALRLHPERDLTMEQFLAAVKERVVTAFDHQDYPLEQLIERLGVRRDLSRNPLFDVMFVLQNADLTATDMDGVVVRPEPFDETMAKFDLTLEALETDAGLSLRLEYRTNVFAQATIERMSRHFVRVLEALCKEPTTSIGALELTLPEEREQILQAFNETEVPFDGHLSLSEVFERQAAQTPEAVALQADGKTMSYGELNAKANRLARVLRREGVGPDSLVAAVLERSTEMMIAVLAIHKAGGAYLPISPDWPTDRIAYLVKDSAARVVLTQGHLQERLSFDGAVPVVVVEEPTLYVGEVSNLERLHTSHNLAYVIYTSGSTGKPKGVMVEHANVINRIQWAVRAFGFTSDDVILQKTPFVFDVSVWELFTWMFVGAQVCFLEPGGEKEPERIAAAVEQYGVTSIHFVPSMLSVFLDALEAGALLPKIATLQRLFTSGETLTTRQVQRFHQIIHPVNAARIYNMYGPTETTVEVTAYPVPVDFSGEVLPIGRPIYNSRLYVLDAQGNLQPIGVPGELVISGANVARGYLNRPDLTAEKFLDDPFAPGERMYRSGDLARWLPDGNLDYQGRMDFQVKVRGYRIELGEIEAQLLLVDGVKEAVVLTRADAQGDRDLVAYLVTESKTELTTARLRDALTQVLPEYMIPSYFLFLERMPVTSNGKVDRKALPEPATDVMRSTEYVAPRTETEAELAAIWSAVLDVEQVGVRDNFFELGGHSLKASSLVARIYQKMGVKLPLRAVFQEGTIEQLAALIQRTEQVGFAPIEPVAAADDYPLSSAQHRLFILQQLAEQDTTYNMSGVLRLEGDLNVERLEAAVQAVIARHEVLRTAFVRVDGEPRQVVREAVDFSLTFTEAREPDLRAEMEAFVQPFDLAHAPLLRMRVLRVASERHLLLFDMHHIISDGASVNLLMQDLIAAYRGEELQPLAVQYKDYAAWQDGFFTTERLQEQQAYWQEQFVDEVPVLNLTGDFSRPAVMEHAGHAVRFEVGRELTDRLQRLAAENGLTLYMILLAAYSLLLCKYANQEDLVIGTPVAGRAHPDAESVMGMFVNTLTLRLRPERERTIEQFLAAVKEHVVAAFDHQDYPYEGLIEQVGVRRDLSRNPLFDVMFVLQNADLTETQMGDVVVHPQAYDEAMAKFDLTLEALESGTGLSMRLEYRTKLFAQATIERMSRHLMQVLEALCAEATTTVGELELALPEEREQILQVFNDTDIPFDEHKTLPQIFEEQVAKTPEAVALQADGKVLTYAELNAKANQLARVLRREGVGPDTLVAMLLERSAEMMMAVLAVHKAGGAYVPIMPDWPAERIAYLLADSAAQVVLTQERLQERLPAVGTVLTVDDPALYAGDASNLEPLPQPTDLAYVIYTSGSTGKPKGVMVEHRSVINRIEWAVRTFAFAPHDVILQKTPYVFDVSVWELFTWMFVGAQVCFLEPGAEKEPDRIAAAIERYGVTSIHFVPPMLSAFLDALADEKLLGRIASVQRVFASGEALTTKQVQRFHQIVYPVNGARIYNLYGPTEATVEVAAFPVPVDFAGDVLPIGKPIHNTRLYVVDENLRLQPIGVPGELMISGVNVARGYRNRPELTAEKFVDDPFVQGARMYKTGDLVRWLPDGNLEYQGRLDHQVKVRGYRIELGEIEAQLLLLDGVKEAVVLCREDAQGNNELSAYLVTETALTTADLRRALAQELPDYMIPSYFVFLERMPITTNGKVDRKALPEPKGETLRSAAYLAPRTKTEADLAAIWSAVLELEQVGVHDDFFELGGHSLKASNLIARIYQQMGVKLPLRAVFQAGTLAELAAWVDRTEQEGSLPPIPVVEADDHPLSSAQKRLFILHQLAEGDITYNMPGVLELQGRLDVDRLQAAMSAVIARHEALRTSFVLVDGEPRQVVQEACDFKLSITEGADLDLLTRMQAFVQPFDLAKAPLLRMQLLRVEPERHLLLLDMHHIISDGASVNLLMQDLIAAYRGEEKLPLAIQYKDYVAWHDSFFTTERMQAQQAFWQEQFADEVPVLNLTGDYARPAVKEYAGDALRFELGRELTDRLQQLAAENGMTLYMILLAAYALLLGKYANQEDVVIGSPVAGRAHPDAESVMGMFVNTLALRVRPERERTLGEFLAAVKERVVAAFDHQEYPYEQLIEQVGVRRDLSRNPLFDVLLVLQNADFSETRMGEVVVKPHLYDETMAKFDLTLEALETSEGLSVRMEYRTKLFARATIERMSRHLVRVLEVLCTERTTTVGALELTWPEEREQILQAFNDTEVPLDGDRTLSEIFEAQADKTPEAVAVQADGQVLTYAALNAKANQLARVLRRAGVGPDTLVALLMERSAEMMISILAIHKAGGAYVPITPDWPTERIGYLLEDSRAQVVLTQTHLQARVPAAGTVLAVDDAALYTGAATNLEPLHRPTDLAYVIYTSGSTGKPKGVMVEHRSVINRIEWAVRTFAFAPHDVILQKTPYVFDVSVWELFTWMFVGAQVCFLPPGAEKEPDRIAAAIEQYGVTAVHFVPSMLSAFLDALEKGELLRKLSTVQWVFATGEPLTTKQVQRFHKVVHPFNGARIYNLYGPTEATVEVSAYQVPVEFAGDAVPIGKPIDNTKIYVLDAQQGLQPIGVPGELMISGVNVARGYWSRPELTAEKFVRDPFDETARMYKTGDLARWLPDGNLEYLGRMDHQVKIRGYRIELGEIEAQLLQVGAVKEAVVLNLEDAQGDNYLAAYLVTEEKRTAAPLREELAKVLPDYMIPSYFLFLDRMPVTTNGKVDRKALPEPTVDLVRTTEYVAPRTQTEADLAMLWAAVLNIEEVGVHDNFFELGGHSLKANDLITRLYREWQVELPLREVFQYPTVAELAVRLEAAERTEYEEIPPVQQADAYPISPAQKRLFVLDQLEGPSTRYNMSAAMLVEGELDKARFEATLRTLIDRHESLRTSFTFQNGEAVQVVHDEVPFVIDELEGTEDTAHRQIHEYFRPFQLDVAPLLRVGLLRTGPQRAYLLLDMHHIISDGTSMGIFIREFMQAYEGQELPLMSVQYKDFTVWHAASDAADKAEAQAPFWQEEFADAVPVLDLPLDAPRPLTMSYEGAKHHFEVSAELSEALQKFSQEQGVTLFMTLLAAFNVLLARYSGQQDLVVGSPVSGRFHPAQEQMIGMFVNTLALRNFPAFDKPFAQFVQEVKERQLRAFEHQEYPFDKLVETVQPARDQSRSPVIDTLFVLQNREQHEFACEGLTLAPYPLDMPLAKFDLSFYAAETESGFACDLEYRTKLFAAETIAGMADRLVRVLEEVVRDPQRPIGDLQWLASEEQAQAIAWATEQDERYVLNKRGRLQPAGVIGELYLTTPPQEQPKENGWPSEVAHPVEPDRTLYRAGVTARYTQAGSLDVIGRSDQEVMLNGYRLHLADVAKGLQAHDEVREAVVILREMAGREVLCAYVATYLAAAEVKAYAESIRPEPLVPSYFTVLAELPRTVAGDVDEALLPQPQAMEEATKESGPMNPTEARLMQIWSQVLGQAAIGAEEDFFFDLSGNSMQATALVAHVFQEFGVEMTLRDVFEAPTIEEMAERIMASDAMADRQIPVVAKAAQYQVSSAQKRLYILNQLEAQPTAYNMPDALIVEGELDHRRFARAFEALVARHESLRTSFAFVNGELTQQVHEQVAFAVDIRQVDEADVARRAEEFVRPFDLSQAPLLRVELLQLKPARHVLLFDMHHIISDGTSMEIVIRDFLALYEERDLPPLRIQYKDYAAWQTEWLEGEEMQKQALYWKEVFAEEPPALDLPNDFPRGARMDFQGDAVRFQLGRELSEHVRQTVSEQGITLFMFLLAGYTALLHRYTGQEDVVVGAPIAGRQHQDIVPLIGMFANTLALRAKPQADKSFRQYLQEVKNVALGAYEHQEYPFELLVDQLQLKHDLSRNPLFDTMLVLQNETSTLESQGLTFAPYHSETTASKFDLILHAVDKTEGIEFILEYRTSLFRAQKVEGIAQHLVQLIASAVAQPDAAIGDLTILNEQEKAELLRMGGAQQERPTETMHQVFERRAAETPERIALQYGDVEVSYGALNARANRLARLLQERGLQSGDLAAVLMERSPRMAESILAVWKAGAAYIPIEPSFPKERILTILQDAQTRVVITDTNCGTDEQGLPYWPQQVDLDAVAERLQEFSSDDLLQPVSVDDLAYVIYTSGSTGKPKGAMIEHVGMMNHLWAKVEDLGLTAQDRIVQNASHSFDISVWQYFAALAVGGTTVIYPNKVTLDPSRFLAVTAQERITILEVVPSYLGLLLRLAEDGATDPQRLVHLRHLLVTGEALQAELSRQWFELFPAITLVNAYGPTEASDDVTHHIMTAAPETELVPIGRAVRNFNLYMVDQRMNLQPFGAVGEICVSGFAVGRGYLGDTEKTRAAFGEDPFVEEPGRRLYKTGDLGKFLPDGSVQYLGRLDHQVKVRGFRIELGEIEHQLLRHPQVREAVVMDRQDANDMTFLCAFVGGEGELNEATLRASLALDLPDYMIPASFVLLEQMPLTPNGKVDRKALARLQVSAGSTQELVAPRTPYEKALVPLWAEVLGVADVGVTENFFELGGHSLKAMNLVSHVYKVLNAHLPLNVVFNHPTIEQLAAFLEQQASSPFADIPAVEQAEFYPVSSPQKRLFLLDQMEDIGTTYNIPFAVILEGPLDQKRFDRAFQKLAERHEALRTSFTFANGVPVQKVHDRVVVPVERMQAKLEELDDVMQAFVRPFDLTQAPLLRVGLVELEADLHALLFDIHHIVSDGVSSNVMMTDFLALYRGQLLEPLRIQYKDFSIWQNEWLGSDAALTHRDFWVNLFRDGVPVLELPTDRPRREESRFEGDLVRFSIDGELRRALERLGREKEVTLFMTLITAYQVLLFKYTGDTDFVIGTPVAGRSHPGLDRILGMFINTLPLRLQVDPEQTFASLLEDVRTTVLQAFEHQDYPLDLVVEALDAKVLPGRNPLMDTMFVLQNVEPSGLKFGELTMQEYEFTNRTSKFDLSLIAYEGEEAMHFLLEYATALFDRETVETIAEHYANLLARIVENPETTIVNLDVQAGTAAEEPEPDTVLADADDLDFDF